MTQSYGPEARGGASSTNVVVADEPIDYPFVQRPDILVALSQEAFDKFYPTVKSQGLILIDEELVEVTDQVKTVQIPCTRLAESLGRRIVANVVMLGFFTGVTDVVSHDAVEQAITKSVKPKTLSLNLRAFEAGYQYALDKELAR
jgi:2-oxoglutarate ferredoxin oxidoreductase subunit gamma